MVAPGSKYAHPLRFDDGEARGVGGWVDVGRECDFECYYI